MRDGLIRSRAAGTNQAVLDAVSQTIPGSVLDVGCGEGWLVRHLREETGVRTVGIDASQTLVSQARKTHPAGDYVHLHYDELEGAQHLGLFDVAVCNFSLLDQRVHATLGGIRKRLVPHGNLIIQTLHPWSARGTSPYRDGWREERFDGLGNTDWRPMPWYYRTLESWLVELTSAQFDCIGINEPLDPTTSQPLSIVFRCRRH